MNHFEYRGAELFVEELPLATLAQEVGTPTYVYSEATVRRHVRVLSEAFAPSAHLVCYSVKASSNLSLLRLLASLGTGFDVVSGGELARVRRVAPEALARTVFSGVGKTKEEMRTAIEDGILMFNVESGEELRALDEVARSMDAVAPFALRINPHVDAKTHRHVSTALRCSKFGVPFEEGRALYKKAKRMRGVRAVGVDCHIGSQLTDARPIARALRSVRGFCEALLAEGHGLTHLDVGGGLGIPYGAERPPSPKRYAEVVREATDGLPLTIVLEPGRVVMGNAGVLLTRVLYRKVAGGRNLVIVDAAMNDLLRPALYDARHRVLPVLARKGAAVLFDMVGPICESTDVLARGRRLPLPRQGDLLALASAGAYGMSMASTYNSRCRPAEVLVDKASHRVIRRRELPEELFQSEL